MLIVDYFLCIGPHRQEFVEHQHEHHPLLQQLLLQSPFVYCRYTSSSYPQSAMWIGLFYTSAILLGKLKSSRNQPQMLGHLFSNRDSLDCNS